MAAKQIQSYVLGVVINVDNKQSQSALQATEKQVKQNTSSFTQFGKEIAKQSKQSADELRKLEQQIYRESTSIKKLGMDLKGALSGDKEIGRRFAQNLTSNISDVISNLGPSLGATIGSAIAPGVGTAIGGALGSAVQTGLEKAAGPVMSIIQRGLELNDVLEMAQVHFTAFTGSEKEAATHLEFLKKLSTSAGLDLPMLLTADQRLEEFNDDLKLSQLELRAAADASARFGSGAEGFQTIADTLGLIAERGELSAKTLLKLQKQGIPAVKYLAEATGMSEQKIKALMAQGRIDGSTAARLISEGIERNSGGYAAFVANTTSIGRERQKNALQDQLAITGTQNLQRLQDDFTDQLIKIYQSPKAQAFVQFLDSTTGKMVDALEKGARIGSDIGGGVISGLLSGDSITTLTNGLTSYKDTFVNTLKGAFGIHSPSTVTAEEIGIPMAQGVTTGFVAYMQGEGREKILSELESLLKDARIQALLDTIGKGEGTFDPKTGQRDYGKRFGGSHFDLSTGAGAFNVVRSGRYASSATGFGQFLGKTWRGLERTLGPLDIRNPHDQELAMVELMRQRGMIAPLMQGDIAGAIRRGGREWASLPGSPYGQPTQTMSGALSVYNSRLGAYLANGAPVTNSNPMPVMVVSDIKGGASQIYDAQRDTANAFRGMRRARRPTQFGGDVLVNFDPNSIEPLVPPAVKELPKLIADLNPPFTVFRTEISAMQSAVTDFGLGVPPNMKTIAQFNQESRKEFALTNEAIKRNQRELITSVNVREQLSGALGAASSFLPQEQVGKKRGLFSKILGFAAPFLSFIPGVGPILSQVAGIASNAVAGNWQGAIAGAAGLNFHTGGGSSAPSAKNDFHLGAPPKMPHRALGGPVSRGRAYIVGEHRPEVFIPQQDGFIHPNARGLMQGGGQGSDPALLAMMDKVHQVLDRIQSIPARDILHMLPRAMDGNAGLIEQMGRRLRLA